MNIEEITESYLNGKLTITKNKIFEKPWLQSDIYEQLPEGERELFMRRCRAWHQDRFSYNHLNRGTKNV